MRKSIFCYTVVLFCLLLVAGCSKMPEGLIKKDMDKGEEELMDGIPPESEDQVSDNETNSSDQQNISLYFWDKENNMLVYESQNIEITDTALPVEEIVKALIKGPKTQDLQPVIYRLTKILGVEQTDDIVTIDLSKEFLKSESLLVARTSIVNTLVERGDIEYVKITVNGRELTVDGTPDGETLGVLSKSSNRIDELIAAENRQVNEDSLKEVNRELFFRDFRGNYLLPEVRPVKVKNGGIARAIIEELIKGPVETSKGLYPVIPKGTKLLDAKLLDGGKTDMQIVALYFSKDIKVPFLNKETSRGEKHSPEELEEESDLLKSKEAVILSSIVYSLSGLNNIEGVKIFYQNDYNNYIDMPLYDKDLKKPLSEENFPNKLGKKLKIYFPDSSASYLVPDYRAMSRENLQIAKAIIDELILGPRDDTEQIGVMPQGISSEDIKVSMDKNNIRVIIDLPGKLDGNRMGSTGALMTLYSIVNSLTDPVNTSNIKEVQFMVDGHVVNSFGNLEFSEPFIRNPAIIQE
ncbi:MAG: GerMN domain-containing protein [Clostridiales bacterium]|nr:GerMN domain-containing protein [Clostridiales bacterium]